MPRRRRNSRFSECAINVFVNCPFDSAYQRVFRAIVFAVIHCGFRARCALEIDDSAEVRIDKIFKIVEECRYGIHDLSRTELDSRTRLPRFNMPLELGLFLGAKRFGASLQRKKRCLVLDRAPHRYQKFISDIAGQDIKAHRKNEDVAIALTRDWLRNCLGRIMPGGNHISRQYRRFNAKLPELCGRLQLRRSEMTFNDFANIATDWVTTQSVSGIKIS
jgi:hypothetical protein